MARGIFEEDADGVLQRGPHWGTARIFCNSDTEFQRLLEALPAAYVFENAGPRPANNVARRVKSNQAIAREAIYADLRPAEMGKIAFRLLPTTAAARFSGNPNIRYEYTVISNIYAGGLPPVEAASVVTEKTFAMLRHRAAGNRLERLLRSDAA